MERKSFGKTLIYTEDLKEEYQKKVMELFESSFDKRVARAKKKLHDSTLVPTDFFWLDVYEDDEYGAVAVAHTWEDMWFAFIEGKHSVKSSKKSSKKSDGPVYTKNWRKVKEPDMRARMVCNLFVKELCKEETESYKIADAEFWTLYWVLDAKVPRNWEGDIVKSMNCQCCEGYTDFEIEYQSGSFVANCRCGKIGGHNWLMELISCKIVGNIHENPELLQEVDSK